MARSRWFDSPTPRVFAHRGYSEGSRDNSLAAFSAAWAAGAKYLESDIRVTADGVPVLMHDATFDVPGQSSSIAIAEVPWARAQSALVDGYSIISLEEALLAFPDANWNLDLKVDAAVLPTTRVLRQLGATDRVLMATFSGQRSRVFHELMPTVPRSLPARRLAYIVMLLNLGRRGAAYRLLRGYHAVQSPIAWRGVKVLTPRVLREFAAFGIEVHVWTVNDVAVARQLLLAGASGIFTDNLSPMLQLVNTLGENDRDS